MVPRSEAICEARAPGLPGRPGAALILGLVLCLAAAGPLGGAPQGEGEDPGEKKAEKPAPARQKPKAAERPASHPEKPAPPLSFTDDDLKTMFHPEVPDDEAASEDGDGAAAKPAPKGPAKRPPAKAAAPPADPLKAFHDRAALEKFRQEQIDQLRSKIAEAQTRLDYLKAKKDAIENPAGFLQPGRTAAPPRPSIAPGRPSGPVPGFFPNLPAAQTDDDKQDDARMKPKALLEKVDDEIKRVEEDLAGLRTSLVRIETRFQGETGPR